jgi:hypothetical protein
MTIIPGADRLLVMAAQASGILRASIESKAAEICEALDAIEKDAKEVEKEPVLTLSFSIKYNRDAATCSTKLSYGVRRSVEASFEVEDPNQITLPVEGESDEN